MDDELLTEVVRLARAEPEADAAAVVRVGAAVRASRTRRHPLLAARVSYAFAAVLALAMFAAGAWWRDGREGVVGSPATASAAATPVTFVLVAEHAQEVAVVGDFNDWTAGATRLRRQRGGVWSVVVPLQPGRYSYAFLVDDSTWLADPTALPNAEEDFGRPSSIVLVERGGS